ncbi:MAG TPA: AbrB/MazE/SpoVT family DNA-binding domain-containing protein [Dehalococcoidia bacterium]|nr:AbrB/MazE/SpoVT family DNA-binding domain-containing protein [Dehalococcoidia bacterium]
MTIGTIDAKDRLRIPREMRKALGLKPGDAVCYALVDGEIRVRPADDPYAAYGPVARQVWAAYQQHPERFLTHEQVMAELGITQAEIDALGFESTTAPRGAKPKRTGPRPDV